MTAALLLLSLAVAQPPVPLPKEAPKTEKKDEKSLPLGFLKARLLGPAVTSGRVVDFAVHPQDRNTYFVAVASGGVWKTVNSGTTWSPIFDNEASYSIGVVVRIWTSIAVFEIINVFWFLWAGIRIIKQSVMVAV